MTSPRRLAFDLLMRVETGGAFAGVALDAALRREGKVDARDRALATELVYGTLRRALALDFVLGQFSSRPVDGLDPKVRQVLRLGAYQLRHLRVPDHAAVGESVNLCREVGAKAAAGFVNAVLRAVARAGDEDLAPPLDVDPATHLLVTEGLPPWLHDLWAQALPEPEVAELARAVNEPAHQAFRAADPAARDAALARLAEAGIDAEATRYSQVGLVVAHGAAQDAVLAAAPALQPQDEGAQLATAFALAEGPEPLTVTRILDPCAAPGGKACHLAQAVPGAHVVAADLHRRRAEKVAEAAKRLGLGDRVEAHPADATRPLPFAEEASFDLVLLDAPCSGLGTIQRHPEIKLRRTRDDLARLADLQGRLLERAAAYVRPGGRLAYVVCTWSPEETSERLAALLVAHPDFQVEPVAEPGPWEGLVGDDGALWLWPHRHGTDGFWAVRLRRAA